MADALAAELVCIDSNPSIDLSDYDLIGFGSAINFAAHDIRLQRFVSSQNLKGKNVFIFQIKIAHQDICAVYYARNRQRNIGQHELTKHCEHVDHDQHDHQCSHHNPNFFQHIGCCAFFIQ